MNGRDNVGNPQSRRYYQDTGRNYPPHNWNPNPDFQRYDRKNRTNNNNNFRSSNYRGYDPYWQQSRYQDNVSDPNGYANYRRFEKDNYRYPPRFDQRRQSQEDKPIFEYHRQQQIYPSQSKSSLSSDDQLRAKIDEAISIVSEQKKMNKVLGIYQAPVHSIPNQWD